MLFLVIEKIRKMKKKSPRDRVEDGKRRFLKMTVQKKKKKKKKKNNKKKKKKKRSGKKTRPYRL